MNVIPPYPPGGIPVVAEVPPAPAPDEAAPAWWPGWAPEFPTTAPEYSAWAAAALGVVVVVVVVAAMRRRSAAALPGGHVTPPKGGGKSVDVYEKRLLRGILVLAPALLGLTFYGSFHAVEKLAADHKVDPSWIPPVAIDGILLLFLFVDLYFAKTNRSNPFVKNTTRGFIAFTLVANAAAGWPDPVAVLLHIPAPLGIVVITEVARQALVRQAKKAAGDEDFDEIPFTRWILDPIGTASMRRWMILRNVKSYPQALAMNEARRDALAMLAALTPSQRAQVPGYLRRRLRVGMDVSTTVRSVRTLVATVTVGGHLAPFVSRVDAAAPGVEEAGTVPTPDTAPAVPGVGVHSEPTPPPTPAPAGGVDEAPNGVGHCVDEALADSVSVVSDDPAPNVRPTPAHTAGVDEAGPAHPGPAVGVDAHTGPVWVEEAAHTGRSAHEVDAAPTGVDEDLDVDVVAATDGDHGPGDGDDEDGPDDDGPRGGGSPAPADVLPGQITIADALEGAVPAPGPLEVARVALDAPTWDEVAGEDSKKDKVLALLWEFSGDVAAVRAAWQDRAVEGEFPRDVYRRPSATKKGGYAWQWHHEVTDYLMRTHGHADTVRAILAGAGVDHDHEAVTAALDEWSSTHSDQVIQFPRPVHTGS